MSDLQLNRNPQLMYLGAVSLIGMALCYIGLFIIYGAVLSPPGDNGIAEKVAYLIEHRTLVKSSYILGYVLFACFLCISVQAIHALYCKTSQVLINTASLFGLFWAIVLLCTGMIGITSLELMSTLDKSDQPASEIVYLSSLLMEESLGGGIEILGGLWVFLLGFAGWYHKLFSKPFAIFSIVKGAIGVFSLFATDEIFLILFGLTGIVWFIWLSAIVFKIRQNEVAP